MKTLWILAAAATFAACHNRSQDETGAAPNKGDTTMVKTDTSTMAKPSTGYDTTSTAKPTTPPSPSMDTTSAQPTAPPSSGGYDTTSTAKPTAPPSAGYDTTMAPKAGGTTSDSASTQR